MENELGKDLIKDLNSDIAKSENTIDESPKNYLNEILQSDNRLNFNTGLEDLTFSIVRQAKIPEGRYSFVLKNVYRQNNQITKYGLKDQIIWDYKITDQKGNRFSITDRSNISDSSKSKFRKNLKSYCEALNLTEINLNNLIGIKGTLTVKHNTDDDGNTYENVEEIQPTDEFEKVLDDNSDEFDL
ncbi:DUF669 domain-containing protein [Clostridium butyricum]|uniref:DUF669 domain-containing protein n=1 Tax=Clostridium butyricum TaxID=1492 RepID=UPI00168B63B8|nr:DUF669 domain-containing protein [Clostridium butyricum]MDB2152490.1 DUF669 domain-containing protein [Clostridium butyricum]